jgi:hypothetical protein
VSRGAACDCGVWALDGLQPRRRVPAATGEGRLGLGLLGCCMCGQRVRVPPPVPKKGLTMRSVATAAGFGGPPVPHEEMCVALVTMSATPSDACGASGRLGHCECGSSSGSVGLPLGVWVCHWECGSSSGSVGLPLGVWVCHVAWPLGVWRQHFSCPPKSSMISMRGFWTPIGSVVTVPLSVLLAPRTGNVYFHLLTAEGFVGAPVPHEEMCVVLVLLMHAVHEAGLAIGSVVTALQLPAHAQHHQHAGFLDTLICMFLLCVPTTPGSSDRMLCKNRLQALRPQSVSMSVHVCVPVCVYYICNS